MGRLTLHRRSGAVAVRCRGAPAARSLAADDSPGCIYYRRDVRNVELHRSVAPHCSVDRRSQHREGNHTASFGRNLNGAYDFGRCPPGCWHALHTPKPAQLSGYQTRVIGFVVSSIAAGRAAAADQETTVLGKKRGRRVHPAPSAHSFSCGRAASALAPRRSSILIRCRPIVDIGGWLAFGKHRGGLRDNSEVSNQAQSDGPPHS